MTKSDVRKKFLKLGFKVPMKTNPFNEKLLSVHLNGLHGNVYSKTTYVNNKEGFELITSLSGTVLDNGQKIV